MENITTYEYAKYIELVETQVPFSNTSIIVMKVIHNENTLYISLYSYTTMRGLNDLFFGVSTDQYGTDIVLRTKTLSELFNCSRVYLNEDLLKTMFNSLLRDLYLSYKINIPVTISDDFLNKIIKNFKRIRHYCEVTPVNNFINNRCMKFSSRNYQGFRNDIYDGGLNEDEDF